MRIRRRALAVAAALLAQGFALAPGARAEETILFYERLTQTVALRPAKEGGNVVTDTSRTETMVALGDHRLAVYDPMQVSLYDFGRRRVQTVSTRHGTPALVDSVTVSWPVSMTSSRAALSTS